MMALERKKEKREAPGEIETEHPDYLGSQDTYKNVGHDFYLKNFATFWSLITLATHLSLKKKNNLEITFYNNLKLQL